MRPINRTHRLTSKLKLLFRMANKKTISDILSVILIYLIVVALLYLVIMKFKFWFK